VRPLALLVLALAAGACGKESTSPSGLVFSQVSAGDYHSCAIATGGAMYCWGRNDEGQLGIGTSDSTAHPVPLEVLGGQHYVSVTTGNGFTCGVAASGGTWCWGLSALGALGSSVAGDACVGGQTCVPIPSLVTGGLRFASVGAGATFVCAVSSANAAYCWGYDDQGQLGNGTTSVAGQDAPAPISGQWQFVSVAGGSGHACALTTGYTAMCWGANERGQLGIGNFMTQTTATAVAGGLTFSEITAGTYHTCAITPLGAAYCWGHNHYGRLGNGLSDNQNQWSPQAVVGGLTFTGVSAGGTHTCGVAAGAAWCWGNDRYGQLGDGIADTLVHPSPEPVVGGLTFRMVSAGIVHSCGVTPDGRVWCWGDNSYGELGDGTTSGWTTPVPVSDR